MKNVQTFFKKYTDSQNEYYLFIKLLKIILNVLFVGHLFACGFIGMEIHLKQENNWVNKYSSHLS